MQLTYRGQAYTATTPAVQGVESEEVATFLGKNYHRKNFSIAQQQKSIQEFQFLGRRYTR